MDMKHDLPRADISKERNSQQKEDVQNQITVHLRVLATTDIHMQVLGHDYVRDHALGHHGLAGLATLIDDARAEAHASQMACVLFDNGDLLQGSALGDHLARMPVTAEHPVLQFLQEMSYDAWGIGNHDLDHGLRYPLALAEAGKTPMISSNLKPHGLTRLRQSLMINCPCPPTQQHPETILRLGVVSALPDQTALWNRHVLEGHADVAPAHDTLIETVAQLRAQGADLVILLAHMGIDEVGTQPQHPDDVRTLAAIPGIDAIVAGHTHRRLPGGDHDGYADVDHIKGTLANRPAAMPGFDASDLAILDLHLVQTAARGWQVHTHQTQLRANTPATPPHPKVTAIFGPAHDETRRALAVQIGHSTRPLHNFFSLAAPTSTCALVAQAKHDVITRALEGLPEGDLPILATASAHTAGGRGGPGHFLDISRGPILRRHLTGLNPYANEICALRVNGADLRRWLEHVASMYHLLKPGAPDQKLTNPHRPSFDFDTIYGLEYRVDPTRPSGQRIVSLNYAGAPVELNQPFVLATNQFRASGGGGGVQFGPDQILYRSQTSLSDALNAVLSRDDQGPWQDNAPWQFECSGSIQAIVHTSPEAIAHLDEISNLHPVHLGTDKAGFARIRITL